MGGPGGAIFDTFMEPSTYDTSGDIGDITAGISPGMRKSMDAQSGQNRALVHALMQNPLFANDPTVMASLAGSYEVGAGPRGDTLMGPQVTDVLNTQQKLRSQQVAKGAEEITGLELGNEGTRFKTRTAQGVGPELSATQKAILGVKEEDVSQQSLRRYVTGQASQAEKRYVEEQILPTLDAERRKNVAAAGLAEAQGTKAKAEAAAAEAQGGLFKSPLLQKLLSTLFSHNLKQGNVDIGRFDKAKKDITDAVEDYYNKSIAIDPQTNPKLAATMDKVFEMKLQQLIGSHQDVLSTQEGRRFLARTLALLMPQGGQASGAPGQGINPGTFMLQGAP